jgi:peptide/nickel transport system substrate-binding protein
MYRSILIPRNMFFFLLVLLFTIPLNTALAASESELVMARQRDAQFLDPNVATSDRSVNGFLFGTIVRRNLYDGSYSRNLAESWEVIDPTTWKFNLRKGVKFHDGTEVTSADVKFSFDRTLGKFDKKFRGYRKGAIRRLVASIETPDDYTVIIKTKYADASFLGVSLLMNVVPKAYVEKLGDKAYAKKPIGFGPFKVTEIKVGEYLKMEAFEDFWNANPKQGETGRAKVKTVTIRTLPQEATMVAALKAGEVDGIYGVNVDSVKDLGKYSDISIFRAPTSLHGFMILNFRAEKELKTNKPNPLRDVRVRQALNYALDWDSLIKNYLTGHEWRTTLIGRTQIGYDPNAPIYPYDPEKARKLIKEAGYGKDLSLPFHYPEQSRQPYMDAVWDYWRSVGINIKPSPHSSAVNLQGVYKKTSYGIVNWGGGFGPDPGNWFRVMVPYDGLQAMHLAHAKVEELNKKQAVEFDLDKRAELIKQLNEILLKEAWFVPTIRGVDLSALNTKKWTVDKERTPLSSLPLTGISRKK